MRERWVAMMWPSGKKYLAREAVMDGAWTCDTVESFDLRVLVDLLF